MRADETMVPPGTYQHLDSGGNRWLWHLELIRALVVREFHGQYRRSLLGPAWAFLQPLAYMVVFSFLRGVLAIPSDNIPYVLFTFSALVPWTFFANAVSRCGPSITANASILKKVALPREIFPVAAVITSLLDFLMAGVVLIGLMIWYQVPVTLHLLWLPLLLLLTALFALGMGLGVAALGTFKRDVIFAVPFLMQFWLFASPVMYPMGQVPAAWQGLYALNPMVGILEGFRRVLVLGAPPPWELLGFSLLGVALVWLVTWPLFRGVSQYFADVL